MQNNIICRTCKHENPAPLQRLLTQRYICPPCLVTELLRVLKFYHRKLEKRGGIFKSRDLSGHKSEVLEPWRKCKVELLNTVQQYRDILDSGVDSENEDVKKKVRILLSTTIAIYDRDVGELYRIPGILEKEREPENEVDERKDSDSAQRSDTESDNSNVGETEEVLAPGTKHTWKKVKGQEQKKKKKEERKKLDKKIETSTTKASDAPDEPSPTETLPVPRPPRKVIFNEMVQIKPPLEKRDVIQYKHSSRTEPRKRNRHRYFWRSPSLPSKKSRWKSPEGTEWVDTSFRRLDWRDVEARENTGPYGWD
jgi:hypothetical protein